jgi:hypothetical protein
VSWLAHPDEDALTADRRQTLVDLYRAFNARDIDAALAHLAPGVDWPNGQHGGRMTGRDAVRAYWLKQWSEIEPRVEPLEIDMSAGGTATVRVDQLVRALDGKVLANRQIEHVYEFEGPFIRRMTIVDRGSADDDEDDDEDDGAA